jgi:hypothetical protein
LSIDDFDIGGFLDHIERSSELPLVQTYQGKLAIRSSKKVGKDYVADWNDFGHDFLMDMLSLRSGYHRFVAGVGHEVKAALVGGKKIIMTPEERKEGNWQPVALVPIMGANGMGELEIGNTVMVAGFRALHQAYQSEEMAQIQKGIIPEVRYTGSLRVANFTIIGWELRDENVWGSL